jgi:TP901 family phage tail tape measure protein
MAATLQVPTIFTAVDRVSNVVNRLGRNTMNSMNRAQRGVGTADKWFNKLTPSIGDAGKEMLNYVSAASLGAAAFAGAKFGIDSVMDYETALHSLSAVTGESSDKFKGQVEDIAKRSKKSAIDVASSFEVIGSAMSQYLDNPKALGQITEAGITLSKAARTELTPTLENLTSVMNQFKLGAEEANKTINILTAGEIVGSVSTAKVAEGLKEFGANAYGANVELSESVALIETLGKQMDHTKIAVGARNLLNVLATAKGLPKPALASLQKHNVNLNLLMDKTKPLGVRLKELSKIQNDAIAVANVFGKENLTAGNVIFSNLKTYDEWEAKIRETNKAQEQAATNSDTLKNRVEEVKNSFVNWAVSGDSLNPTLTNVKDRLVWLADNIDLVITSVATFVKWFLIVRGTIWAAMIAMAAYNIILGIFAALNTSSAISLGTNTLALRAWYITTLVSEKAMWLWAGVMKVVTAAQWLWNAAMTANPIGLIIVGIAALIGFVVAIIYYWDEWGSTVVKFLGPLGLVIDFIMTLIKNWDMVKKAFQEGGIKAGLMAIGRVLFDVMLKPVQMLLAALAKIPGLSKLATNGLQNVTAMRAALDVQSSDSSENKSTPALSNPTVKQGQITNENVNTTRNLVDINLNNPFGGSAGVQQRGPLAIPVKVTPTNGRK